MTDEKQEKINDALLKVALGCQVAEVTEEYAEVDGELKLTKRKKTKRDIPPDLKAVQILLSSEQKEYATMSDEELETERLRLLAALKAETVAKAENSDARSADKKTVKKTASKTVKKAAPMKKRRQTKKKNEG